MEHTYLRYECADSFGLTVASGSSKSPQSNDILHFLGSSRSSPLLTIAGSQIVGTNLKTSDQVLRIGHREELNGGGGTGKALNSNEVVCLDVNIASDGSAKIATGWIDGTVRIFDLQSEEVSNPSHGLANSLLVEDENDSGFVQRQPLVLNGHDSPVRALVFGNGQNSVLASGGSDGAVVVWDVVSETGLFRLIGHRGGITNLQFIEFGGKQQQNLLVSSSLDGLVKIWDLSAQCCIQTLASHRGEVLALASIICDDGTDSEGSQDTGKRWRLLTGGTEGRAKVWNLQPSKRTRSTELADAEQAQGDSRDEDDVCTYMGQLLPPPNVSTSAEKISCIHYHESGKYIGVLQNSSKSVDIYALRSVKESLKKRQRRMKRKQEKKKKASSDVSSTKVGQKRGLLDDPINLEEAGEGVALLNEELDPELVAASDEFEYLATVRASHKVRSFSFFPSREKGEILRVVCALATNSLETVALERKKDVDEIRIFVNKIGILEQNGHPTGIRSVSISADDSVACTVSKGVVKIWNVASRRNIQSLVPVSPSSNKKGAFYGLCGTFLSRDYVIIGTREGGVAILDTSAGEVIDIEEGAHDGAIWGLDVRRPAAGSSVTAMVTGSADKSVKFWDIETDEETKAPILVHSRTLHMTDDVVSVRYSKLTSEGKGMVFVSTLDSTVKVFFEDSLKLFLNLYGHKLPALAVDASDDNMLLASSGADKTIKLWGLDFGDTHRTLHGHQDSVTDLKFLKRAHNFFSASKDGTIRYWDGDRFTQILLLNGHYAEVNCLAVSRTGAFVLSGGMDRQVRVWERTRDIVFIEEEKEVELTTQFDRIGRDEGGTLDILSKEGGSSGKPESEAAVKKGILSVSSGDRIIEGLERADTDLKEDIIHRRGSGKPKTPNPLMLGLPPAQYVLWILRSIPPAELEQSLLLLPLSHVERLVYYIVLLLKEGRGVEICSKVGVFLVKTHQNQIVASQSMATPIRQLKRMVRKRVAESRDVVGYDLAALRLIARVAADRKPASFSTAPTTDLWADLGVGSDVAAILQGKPPGRQ